MSRAKRPPISRSLKLPVQMKDCPTCGAPMWSIASTIRTVVRMDAVTRLRLQIKACHNPGCERYKGRVRPEQEGRIAITQNEFGMDVLALVGELRHVRGLSGPKIYTEMISRGVPVCLCSASNLIKRHDEMIGLVFREDIQTLKIRRSTQECGIAFLAIDCFPPVVGTQSLWIIRDTISKEVLVAKRIESASEGHIYQAMNNVKRMLSVPVVGIIYDGSNEEHAKLCRKVAIELYGEVSCMSYEPIEDDDGGRI